MKRTRSDSIESLTKTMQSALAEINPPPTAMLDDADMVYWKDIIDARHDWSKVDLHHAANLARTLRMIDDESSMLKAEGSVTLGGKSGNTSIMNPRHTVLEQLSRRAAALSQKLQVHSQATMGNPRDNVKKNKNKKDMMGGVSDLDDDESSLIGGNA